MESLFHLGYFTWMSSHYDKIINTHLTRLLSYQSCHIYASNVGLLSGRYCRQICTNLDRLIWMRNSGHHKHHLSGLVQRRACMCFMGITFQGQILIIHAQRLLMSLKILAYCCLFRRCSSPKAHHQPRIPFLIQTTYRLVNYLLASFILFKFSQPFIFFKLFSSFNQFDFFHSSNQPIFACFFIFPLKEWVFWTIFIALFTHQRKILLSFSFIFHLSFSFLVFLFSRLLVAFDCSYLQTYLSFLKIFTFLWFSF